MAAAALSATLAIGTGPAGAAVSPYVAASGPLTDLMLATDSPTDGASARVYAVARGTTSTYVVLFITGLDTEAVGETYGAHVHRGVCVEGMGSAALGHYNSNGLPATPENEVWLDFTILPGGYGYAITTVPFQIQQGTANSVVIHAEPTQEGGATPGAAGGRIACLPVAF